MQEFTTSIPTDGANLNSELPLGKFIFATFYKKRPDTKFIYQKAQCYFMTM